MVEEIINKGRKYYQCKECKLIYKEKDYAEKCEKWCKEHKNNRKYYNRE